MKKIAVYLLLSLFSQTLLATPAQYDFQPSLGKVEFKTKGWPNLIVIKGEGSGVSGQITAEGDKVSGQLVFDLTTLKTGIELRDDHMKNKYLEVKNHPKALLTLTKVEIPQNREGSFNFKGVMKLHGVEKEISGEAELNREGGALQMNAKILLKLSDFKIAIPNYQGITVAEKVNVNFETQVRNQ